MEELTALVKERMAALDQFMSGQTETTKKQAESLAALEGRFRRYAESNARMPFAENEDGAPARGWLRLREHKDLLQWINQPKSKSSSIAFDVSARGGGLIQKNTVLGQAVAQPVPGVVGPPVPAARLASVIPVLPVSGGSIIFVEESSFTNAAAPQVEGALKAESAAVFVEKTIALATIAHWLKASVQAINDSPGLLDWIERRLESGVLSRFESETLNRVGTGLLAVASPLSAGFTPVAGSVALDVIGSCISQLLDLGFAPDGIVLNAADLNKMRLQKSLPDGSFLWGDPDSTIAAASVWGVPVIISPAMAQGQCLVGDFRQSTLNYLREAVRVDLAYEDSDNFTRNLVTVRSEMRATAVALIPSGLVKSPLTIAAATGASRKG